MARRRRGRASSRRTGRRSGRAAAANAPSPAVVRALHRLGLVAVSVVVFAGVFDAGFTYDDKSQILANRALDDWRSPSWGSGWGRQVRTLTLAADRAVFADSALGYHAHSLAWHAVAVLLVYELLRRLTRGATPAFAGALLFAVHPIHVEAVANIANRKEPLCLAFSLACFLAYVRFLDAQGPRRRVAWLAGALASGVLALFSKQVAIALPLSLLVYEWLYVERERRFALRRPAALAVAGVAAAAALAWWVDLFGYLGDIGSRRLEGYLVQGFEGEPTVAAFALTSARAFWRMLALLAWPDGLCPDHRVTLSTSLREPVTLAAWIALLLFAAGAFAAARASRLLSFGMLWILVHFLPVSNLIPAAYVLADRYAYIPSVGFCAVLVAIGRAARGVLARTSARAATAAAAAGTAALAVGWAAVTVAYTAAWASDATLWRRALRCNPQSHRAFAHLATLEQREGSPERAIELYDRAISMAPDAANLRYNRGTAHQESGHLEAAIRDYDASLRLGPGQPNAFYNRGIAHLELGSPREAAGDFGRAIALRPEFAAAYVNRGRARLRLAQLAGARRDFERALEIDPENALALYNLAALEEGAGRTARARELYTRAETLGLAEAGDALARLRP